MRPRVFPAEDYVDRMMPRDRQEQLGFNEAAGIPRGRRGHPEGARLALAGWLQ